MKQGEKAPSLYSWLREAARKDQKINDPIDPHISATLDPKAWLDQQAARADAEQILPFFR